MCQRLPWLAVRALNVSAVTLVSSESSEYVSGLCGTERHVGFICVIELSSNEDELPIKQTVVKHV